MLDQLIQRELKKFQAHKPNQAFNPTFIPLYLSGGVGDVIMLTDVIKALQKEFQIVIYTQHLEAFRYFYKEEVPSFKVLPTYTWHLELYTIAKFVINENFYGFLNKSHEDLFLKQQALFRKEPSLEMLLKTYFNKFFLVANYAKRLKMTCRQFPMHCLDHHDGLYFNPSPRNKPEKYITIHDGYDVRHTSIVASRATKTWKWTHWNKLVKSLKTEYPNYKIIQLGAITSRAIDGVDECLINKTTLTEAFDILSKSSLHIDGDSGLAHAATRLNIPSVILWGPTPHYFYGYDQNINITSNFCPDACYGVKDNWNDKCVIGYPTPQCMDEIMPEEVLSRIEDEIPLKRPLKPKENLRGLRSPTLGVRQRE